jgi:predicted HTH domain antitoxin
VEGGRRELSSLEEVRTLADRMHQAEGEARKARASLHAAIVQAYQSGEVTLAEIAKASGLTKSRVQQLVTGKAVTTWQE